MRADGFHYREYPGIGPVVLKVALELIQFISRWGESTLRMETNGGALKI